jgi:hypothetical protein
MANNPFLEAFLPAYQQGADEYGVNKRFETNQERLRKLAAQRRSEDLRKQRIAWAKDRKKQLDAAAKETKEASAQVAEQKRRFQIANKRLKPYLDKGLLNTQDMEFVMERVGSAGTTGQALTVVNGAVKELQAKAKTLEAERKAKEKHFRPTTQGMMTQEEIGKWGKGNVKVAAELRKQAQKEKKARAVFDAKKQHSLELDEDETFEQWRGYPEQVEKYGIPPESPQSRIVARSERQATPEQINAIDELEKRLQEIEASLR